MSLTGMIRRLERLENRIGRRLARAPLTAVEIEDIQRRVANEQELDSEQIQRIEVHGHIVGRNMIISARGGKYWVKRYLGVDLDEL
jgi:hypothetical protein